MAIREAPLASIESLQNVHDESFINLLVQNVPSEGLLRVDADTYMSPKSLDAARRVSGALLESVELVLNNEADRSFVAMRPPGHHAESTHAMGFCLINHVAVAAKRALDWVDRVAILDFDVHHGNGTVETFRGTNEVLVCSTFQHPFYPGRFHDVRDANIVLSPLAAGTSSDGFREAVKQDWIRVIESHDPDLIFVSAGFDAHKDDPLGGLQLTDDDFDWITGLICDLAAVSCGGRVISVLEGGYDLNALSRCVEIHLERMLDSSHED